MQVKDTNKNRRDFGVLAVACLLLQLTLAPNVALGNGRANMALVFAGLVSMLTGGRTGVVCGFLAGIVFDLSTTGPIGLMAFLLTIACFVVGIEARNRLADGFRKGLAGFAGMAAVVTLFYHVAMLLVGQAESLLDVVLLRTVPTTVLTVLAFAPFAWFFAQTTASSLQLGSKSSKARSHGSRYDLGDI